MPFIVIEGIDGSGKTTLANMLKEQLSNAIITKTPSDTRIREILIEDNELPKESQALLFMADMVDVDRNIVAKALAEDKTVICDRWHLSTQIYQFSQVPHINFMDNLGLTEPDFTFILDLPIDDAMQRISTHDRYESDSRAIWDNRRALYLESEGQVINVSGKTPNHILDEVLSICHTRN